MDNTVIILIFVIPILTVLVISLGYKYYYELNRKNKIKELLKKDNIEILDGKKQKRFSKKERNWLGKKLAYAGYPQVYAEVIFIVISMMFGFLAGVFINFVIPNPIVFVLSSLAFCFFPLLVLKKIIDGRLEEFNF
jgi:Flp pilus assembly protein TadB